MDYIVNKNDIKKYKSIILHTIDFDDFEIPSEYIIDLYLENNIIDNKIVNKKGYMILSSEIDAIKFADYEFTTLFDRIKEYCDICTLILNGIDGSKTIIGVLWDQVVDCNVVVVDFVNCHSIERDKNQNIVLKFGELSNYPIVEIKYFDKIIENWRDYIKDSTINISDFEIKYFSIYQNEKVIQLDLEYKKTSITIRFEGFYDLIYEDNSFYIGDYLRMLSLSNGDNYIEIGPNKSFKFNRCYII